MTRSLGDAQSKNIGIISLPEIDHIFLKKRDQFIVLGTDGLWDVMSSAEVVGFILKYKESWGYENKMAEQLAKEARMRWEDNNSRGNFNNKIGDFPTAKHGIDDITVVIAFLNFEDSKDDKKAKG